MGITIIKFFTKKLDINNGCFLLAKAKTEIGDSSALVYGVSIITSADPNSEFNALKALYPAMAAPVINGKDCWVVANSTILSGVDFL